MVFHCAVGYHPTGERGSKPSPISNHHTVILKETQKERGMVIILTMTIYIYYHLNKGITFTISQTELSQLKVFQVTGPVRPCFSEIRKNFSVCVCVDNSVNYS